MTHTTKQAADEANVQQIKVIVGLVHFNTPSLLAEALESIVAGYDGLVVWDNSTSHSAAMEARQIVERKDGLYIKSRENIGFGAACNAISLIAKREFEGTHIVFMNPDAQFLRGSPRELCQELQDSALDMVSARIVSVDGRASFLGGELRLRSCNVIHLTSPAKLPVNSVPFITGAAFAIELERFFALGMFDERFWLYWEDVDLSYRVYRAKRAVGVSSACVVRHDVSASDRRPMGPARSTAFYRFNGVYRRVFVAKYRKELGVLPRLWTPMWTARVALRAIIKERAGLPEVLAIVAGMTTPQSSR